MQESISNVRGALAPRPVERRRPRGNPSRPFRLPDGADEELEGELDDGLDGGATLVPRPRRAPEDRISTEPLAEEAGQSIDVSA